MPVIYEKVTPPLPGLTTGFVFRNVIAEASKVLRNAAGNFYINDKSTGSVVAQQPFGGTRASGEESRVRERLTRHSPEHHSLC